MKPIQYFFLVLLTSTFLTCGKKNSTVDLPVETTPITVAIIPFHDISNDQINLVSYELKNFYGIETQILPKGNLPDSCKKPYKKRYNANKILDFLFEIKPKENNFILALTTEGIATRKEKYKEWGILGLGHRPGPCCVISTANMGKNVERKKDRLIKVCLHEMGHNFGLPHCESGDKKCLMRSANGTVKTIDEEDKYLCNVCSGVLKTRGFKLRDFS